MEFVHYSSSTVWALIDPKVDLAGATPETLATALLWNPLGPRRASPAIAFDPKSPTCPLCVYVLHVLHPHGTSRCMSIRR